MAFKARTLDIYTPLIHYLVFRLKKLISSQVIHLSSSEEAIGVLSLQRDVFLIFERFSSSALILATV